MVEEGPSAYRIVKGFHRFTLEGYSLYKGIGRGAAVYSGSFTVGGHQWAISVFPDGTFSPITKKVPQVYVGIRICLMSESEGKVSCLLSIMLLDQTGQGNHRSSSSFANGRGPLKVGTNEHLGFPGFIRREALENSCYLKDDCLKIECTLAVLLPSETEIQIECPIFNPSLAISQCGDDDDDNVSDFRVILESGEASDVTIYVSRMRFQAHKVILSARSSFFDSMFDSSLPPGQHEKIFLTGIEPQVFKAVLHFIYTDTLPEDERSLVAGNAFGPCVSTTFGAKLLAAAEEYGLKRLKSICESHLWRSINLNRLVETLALAERYNASKLKNLCLQFAADNFAALMELDIFAYFKKNYPLLFKEVDGDSSKKRLVNLERQISHVVKRDQVQSPIPEDRKFQQKKQAKENERPKTSKLGLSSFPFNFQKLSC